MYIKTLQSNAQRMMSENGFLGIQDHSFDTIGRSQFITLLDHGLTPYDKVVDIGCGCLRAGFWLINFLHRGNYYGLEPSELRVKCGIDYIMSPNSMIYKTPIFHYNEDFNLQIFNTKFDFFLAYSIFTHASKDQTKIILDEFVACSNPDSVFITSYFPATNPEEDYQGKEWVGTSHKSQTIGIIRHSFEWLRNECHSRNLEIVDIGEIVLQRVLKITHRNIPR